MIRAVVLLLAAFLVVAVLLLGNSLADRSELTFVETSPSTSWSNGPPITLPEGFTGTTAVPKVATKEKPRHDLQASGQVLGYPCGGDLPPCWVLRHEGAGGVPDPTVWNGGCHHPAGFAGVNPCGSTASGLWQALRSTWAGFGGYLNAADAPVDVQNEFARRLWNHGRGCSAWNACG